MKIQGMHFWSNYGPSLHHRGMRKEIETSLYHLHLVYAGSWGPLYRNLRINFAVVVDSELSDMTI